jgi:hypothetical protein
MDVWALNLGRGSLPTSKYYLLQGIASIFLTNVTAVRCRYSSLHAIAQGQVISSSAEFETVPVRRLKDARRSSTCSQLP